MKSLIALVLYPLDYLAYWLYFTFVSRRLSTDAKALPDDHDDQSCRRVLVLSPHQDDESLGCAGYLLGLGADPGQDVEVRVVFATDGAGQRSKRSAAERDALSTQRYREATEACARLGAGAPVFLGFEDGGLHQAEALSEAIAGEIDRFEPHTILAPFVCDAPLDHIEVTRALASAETTSEQHRILLYQVHSQIPAALCNRFVLLSREQHQQKIRVLEAYPSQDFGDCLTVKKYLLMSRQVPGSLRGRDVHSVERYVSLDANELDSLFTATGNRRITRSLNYSPVSFLTFLKNERSLARVFIAH